MMEVNILRRIGEAVKRSTFSINAKYKVTQLVDESVLYQSKKKNIFNSLEWQNYDYKNELAHNPELMEVMPIGREK